MFALLLSELLLILPFNVHVVPVMGNVVFSWRCGLCFSFHTAGPVSKGDMKTCKEASAGRTPLLAALLASRSSPVDCCSPLGCIPQSWMRLTFLQLFGKKKIWQYLISFGSISFF